MLVVGAVGFEPARSASAAVLAAWQAEHTSEGSWARALAAGRCDRPRATRRGGGIAGTSTGHGESLAARDGPGRQATGPDGRRPPNFRSVHRARHQVRTPMSGANRPGGRLGSSRCRARGDPRSGRALRPLPTQTCERRSRDALTSHRVSPAFRAVALSGLRWDDGQRSERIARRAFPRNVESTWTTIVNRTTATAASAPGPWSTTPDGPAGPAPVAGDEKPCRGRAGSRCALERLIGWSARPDTSCDARL